MKTKIIYLSLLLLLIQQLNIQGAILFYPQESQTEFANKLIKQAHNINFDSIYSAKKLGSFVENGKTFFRLFAPTADKVILATFIDPEIKEHLEYEMSRDSDGVWEVSLEGEMYGLFYGYKTFREKDLKSGNIISSDPYSKAVATFTTYLSPRLSIVYDDKYDWEGDSWIQRDWRDLIIYEMHIRDMTRHESSGANSPGSYRGLIEEDIKGGINYIESLGVNTVELLPAMEFANIEIPYKDSLNGRFNNWNPYERNHWGYMTSNFFAPAAYYSTGWEKMEWNRWMGKDGRQVNDFKDMVKAFHKKGIGVIMDVVFNHLSEYEVGNLKEIDKEYYFRLDKNGNYIAESYCGNDLKTERPMLRRLIIDSILYWMKEYHVDGFRFDLGKLIDWITIEEVIREARKVNPNVVFVCEPWGGGYDPTGFSLRDWGAWNDQIRNGIKGENPNNGLGWIFGKWYGDNNKSRIKSYVRGTLIEDKGGLFLHKEHSVNYLESHDGYTLGDFIRIGTGEVKADSVISNRDKHAKLTPLQLRLNKLAALFLFTSQGITMIHSGQEFARSKVIPINVEEPDKHKGRMDHNSYDKDNETNYINYTHADLNTELLGYYKGLIQLRKKYEAFRHADYEQVQFEEIKGNEFALGYRIKHKDEEFVVLFNSSPKLKASFLLPEGDWEVIVNEQIAGTKSLGKISGEYVVAPQSGGIFRRQ